MSGPSVILTWAGLIYALNSKGIYSANEILRLFSSIYTYYPRKYKAVFKLKNATWNQNSQDSNPFVADLISWKKCHFSSFYNMGVILTVIALLYILCKYACAYFRNIDINTYSAHVYVYTLISSHSGIKLPQYLYTNTDEMVTIYSDSYYFSGQCLCL